MHSSVHIGAHLLRLEIVNFIRRSVPHDLSTLQVRSALLNPHLTAQSGLFHVDIVTAPFPNNFGTFLWRSVLLKPHCWSAAMIDLLLSHFILHTIKFSASEL